MADITLTVDVSSLNKASKTLDAFGDTVRKNSSIVGLSRGINTLQNNIRELVSAQQKGIIGGSAYQLGLLQVKRAYEQMGLSSQAATSAVRRYAAELQRQDALRAAEQAAKALARAQQEAAAAASALADRQLDLRRRFQEGYALFERQRQAMRDLREAYRSNIITLQQYQAQLAQIRAGNLSGHINQTSDGLNRMGVAAQQTGYQVSDFIVQVQGGTNPLVAFSQQATQLAGLLYLMPERFQEARIALLGFSISMGAAISIFTIAIPLLSMLAMAFLNSGKEAKEAADGPIKDAEDRIKSLNEALKDYLLTKKAASLGVTKDELISSTGLDEAIAALDAADKKLKQAQENASRRSATGFAPGSSAGSSLYSLLTLSNAEEDLLAAQEARTKAAETLRLVEERIADVYQKQHDALYDNFDLELAKLNLGEDSLAFKEKEAEADRRNYAERLKSSGELNDAQIADLVLIYQAQQDMLKARQAELTEVERVKQATADQLTYMGKTKQESDRFVDSLKSAYALLASSHAAASGIADQMTRAANAYFVSNSVGGASYMANQYSLYGQGRVSGEKLAKESGALYGGFSVLPSPQEANQGGTGPAEATQTAIEKLQEQLAVERELIGTSEAYQKVRSALGEEFKTTSPEVIAGLVDQATQVERLIDLEKQREQVLGTVKSSMEDTLMSIVDGTKSARDAFKAMAADIIKELYRVYVVQQLVNSVSGFIMPSKGTAGSVPRLSQAQPRAAGGSMMANMAYMVGENGPELVIPRHSGTVVNAKQTANTMNGGGSITVQNNINVTGSDAAMVRTEVAKMIPQITNATKAAVLDAKQRGGQFAAAFR